LQAVLSPTDTAGQSVTPRYQGLWNGLSR
jgi:hypothetical protein